MSEHPILFSSEMIREILRGCKTQTRRVVKGVDKGDKFLGFGIYGKALFTDNILNIVSGKPHDFLVKCPYGLPGDRLWVRERWAHDDPNCDDIRCGNRDHIWWYANEEKIVADSFAGKARWHSSIHMPRWASRLTLEIVNIRVEQLQDISRDDAMFEGVQIVNPYKIEPDLPPGFPAAFRDYTNPNNFFTADPVASFRSLWGMVNEKRNADDFAAYQWNSNPWVWVIEFKRLK